jgi:hypothetical protein
MSILDLKRSFEHESLTEKLDQVEKNPTIIKKEQSLFISVSCVVIIVVTQLFRYLYYMIP